MTYSVPIKDMLFTLEHVAGLEAVSALPGMADAGIDTARAVLEECAKFNEEVIAPLNWTGDATPSSLRDGKVTTTPGFAQAFKAYAEAGWQGIQHPAEFGGQGLPKSIGTPCVEMLNAANLSFALCPLLTDGAIEALLTAGTPEQQAQFIGPMIEGRWTGTMNLTEPQAGSDLAMVRTRAVGQPDGTYRVFGQKIYITYGEHDMAENIVHLVLARTPEAPEGVKGISLFIVPKFLINADGSLGKRNDVWCASIEHKLGIKASPTAVLLYGDGKGEVGEGAIGYLVGEENRGLEYMFVMMNAARFAVGMQGISVADRAYQKAVAYARDRVQSRDVAGSPGPVSIIHHPDVRRMLLTARAYAEGGRALCVHTAMLIDQELHHPDEDVRKAAADEVALLTPIVKAFITDNGWKATSECLQVYGGHGYIAEWGMEQYVRDARINMIYEGTNTIQSLDLLGRKVLGDNGKKLKKFGKMVAEFIEEEGTNEAMQEFVNPLADLGDKVTKLTTELGMKAFGNPDEVGGAAVDYLRVFGHLVFAYFWARMAKVALAKKDSGDPFYAAKLHTARFYFAKLLPETAGLIRTARSGVAPLLAMEEAMF